jgi:hypothetical protein
MFTIGFLFNAAFSYRLLMSSLIRKLFHFEAKTKEERKRSIKKKKLIKAAKGNPSLINDINSKYPSSSSSEDGDNKPDRGGEMTSPSRRGIFSSFKKQERPQ